MKRINKQNIIQIVPVLKDSFSLYKSNFVLFVLISLIGSSVSLIEYLLTSSGISLGWFSFIITMIGGMILSIWAYAALIFAVSQKFNGQGIDIKESFLSTKDKIWRFTGVSVFCLLIFAVGFLLMVIPGLYLGTIFALAGLVIVLEDSAFFDSFKRSKDLISGYFWPIFSIYFVYTIIFLPTLFIHKLDIAMMAKAMIMFFISIILGPWGVAINIDIYNRLKNIKGSVAAPKEEGVKKGMGCLGCLGAIGLFIVIIILSTVWFKNIGSFLRTEQGGKVYEWGAEKFSPKIELPDGFMLERPEGYFVMKGQQQFTTYSLYGFLDKKFFMLSVFSISMEDLGIQDKTSIKFGEGEIWDKYYAYLLKLSPYSEMKFKDMEKESASILNLAGRPWGQYKLKEKERKYAKSQKVWVFDYILTDNAVIFVSYGYKIDSGEEEPTRYNEEAEQILKRFSVK